MLQEALDSVAGSFSEQCRSIGVVLLNLKPLAGLAQGLEGRVHWGCGPVLLRVELSAKRGMVVLGSEDPILVKS